MGATLGLLAALAVPAPAAAEGRPATVTVEWELPPGSEDCIGRDELVARVEQRLGRAVTSAIDSADVVVTGRIEAAADGAERWRVAIVARRRDGFELGRRDLSGDEQSCRALDDTLVLVVALIVEQSAPAAVQKPPPPPAPRAPPPPPLLAPSRPGWRSSAGLGVAAGLGLVADIAAGATAGVMARPPPRWPSVGLVGSLWARRTVEAEPGGVSLWMWTVGLIACPRGLGGRSFTVTVCGGVHLGRAHARGEGFDRDRRQVDTTVHASTGLVLERRLRANLAVRLDLGGWLALLRPRYVHQDPEGMVQPVHRPALVAVVASTAVWMSF